MKLKATLEKKKKKQGKKRAQKGAENKKQTSSGGLVLQHLRMAERVNQVELKNRTNKTDGLEHHRGASWHPYAHGKNGRDIQTKKAETGPVRPP